MEKLGYGPDKRLAVKVSARNIAPTRDPAVLLIGQLKEIYVDGELEMVDTTNWFPKVLRKDFTVGMVVSENGLDVARQGSEDLWRHPPHPFRRRLHRAANEDDVRPVLFHPRAAVCNQPWVKGMTQMVNGIYNGSRFEDVWLDK
jgi:peptide/nickel transport system substrate-binding protein